MSERRFDRRPYVTLSCECREGRKKKVRLDSDDEDEEEEVPERINLGDNWKLYVKDGRHNHKIGVYHHAYAHAARLTDDQLKLTEEFSRCQIHMILYDFSNLLTHILLILQ
ncbi:hypothetical protein M9H77_02524 [Catharanthus roseus]|uniref:Uncharacterized protein n=1 Tax=Catharanthus roseus TaxID=4058 RepID=A0ACC0C8Y0_CATRO|nr:hypothetical protein M9H77_02524 [Catharanthus roseus]